MEKYIYQDVSAYLNTQGCITLQNNAMKMFSKTNKSNIMHGMKPMTSLRWSYPAVETTKESGECEERFLESSRIYQEPLQWKHACSLTIPPTEMPSAQPFLQQQRHNP